jgi:hypothetical protein
MCMRYATVIPYSQSRGTCNVMALSLEHFLFWCLQGCCSASIQIIDGNRMKCLSSTNGAVYGTTPLTRATGGSFEFMINKATVGDEVICVGCGRKPVESVSYDSNKLWVVRAYNGVIYGPSKVRVCVCVCLCLFVCVCVCVCVFVCDPLVCVFLRMCARSSCHLTRVPLSV